MITVETLDRIESLTLTDPVVLLIVGIALVVVCTVIRLGE